MRASWHKHFFLAASPLALVASLGSSAQFPSEITEDQQSDFLLEEITVTARRREESLMEVPESISVFEEQLIQDAEIDEIADFAQLTPGVVVQQGFQGGDRPIVVFRGIGQVGGAAPSVLILSDGIYMPSGDPLRNQLFDIQQIEVVKGPQGSLYGRDTIGGVINVISKEPSESHEGAVQVSYLGEADQVSVKGTLNVPLIEDTLYSRFSAGYLESDGFFENASGSDQDFREESYARARLIYRPADNVEVDFRLGYNRYDNGYNASFFSNDASTYYDDVGSLNAVDYSRGFNQRDVWDTALKLEMELGEMTLTSVTQFVESEQNLVQDADFALAPGLQIVRDSLTEVSTWSQEWRLASSAEDDFRWLGGIFMEESDTEFRYSDKELNLLGRLGGSSNRIETSRQAVFGQVDYDFNESLTGSLALRYDDTQRDLEVHSPVRDRGSDTSYMFTPKASLTYVWRQGVSTYITYGEGFRSGGFDAVTNAPFEDEILKSVELGLKTMLLDNRLNLTAALYRINYTDQQIAVLTADPSSGSLITSTENLGESETLGIEMALQYQATDDLSLTLAADWMDTEIVDDPDSSVEGNSTPFSTEFTLSLSGQHTMPIGDGLNLVSRFSYYHQGEQTWDKANTMVQDAYGTLSARVAIEGQQWFLALSGENLMDEQYNDQIFTNFGIPGLNAVYPGLPRRWTVTLSKQF